MAVVPALSLANRPSAIEWTSPQGRKLSFLIMDAPKPNNLQLYLKECKKYNVVRMVRVCEETYPSEEVEQAGIILNEMEYDDGSAPPVEIIEQWLDTVDSTFRPKSNGSRNSTPATSDRSTGIGPTIAIHCVAGLGRAPVLVAIALIENGMDPIDAVEFIRERRRGAINRKQLSYLEQYQRKRKRSCSPCSVM